MGMYSTYESQDLQYDKMRIVKEFEGYDTFGLVSSGGDIDFAEWDGHKIEGYWYDETKKILNKLAKFVKGEVIFLHEEGYLFKIIFKYGKALVQYSEIVWKDDMIPLKSINEFEVPRWEPMYT